MALDVILSRLLTSDVRHHSFDNSSIRCEFFETDSLIHHSTVFTCGYGSTPHPDLSVFYVG